MAAFNNNKHGYNDIAAKSSGVKAGSGHYRRVPRPDDRSDGSAPASGNLDFLTESKATRYYSFLRFYLALQL